MDNTDYNFTITEADYNRMPFIHQCGGKEYKVIGPRCRPPRCSCDMTAKERKERYDYAKKQIKGTNAEEGKKFYKEGLELFKREKDVRNIPCWVLQKKTQIYGY